MKSLRQIIRKIILEDYELTDADIARYRRETLKWRESDGWIRQNADRRGMGIQGKKAIQRDKQAMRDWHELMKQNPQFVKQFMQGKVQILHSLTYAGTYSKKADIQGKFVPTPFSDWIRKFGKRSRDQISCVAANVPIGGNPDIWTWDEGNAGSVYGEGYGFLMKGYPAFGADSDLMTQTLGALSDTLKDFHKNSGQVKRAEGMYAAINPKNWLGIDELILDNWQIIGIYILDYFWHIEEGDSIIADAHAQNLPVYRIDSNNNYKMMEV